MLRGGTYNEYVTVTKSVTIQNYPGEAAWFGVPGRAEAFDLPLATPLAGLRDAVLAGGRLTVCSQCAARRDLAESDLVEGATIAGAAAFTEEILGDGVQALVY